MSAITHAHAYIRTTPSHNPPLALNPRAILKQLQHFATNGPQYVQFQATRSLARIVGLFDRTSDAIRELGFGPSESAPQPEDQHHDEDDDQEDDDDNYP
ncbi:MAG: hypothetical protein OXH40_11515 [Chloroflexi bacterium]|nr:hypothetical protein [Chloroflexota bacterium]MCY3686382.1 hypothetical protein [Chloroflexota bacterium]MDE2708753.1 hypothetical protein [Chloroflexota bacterium]